jgi:apolipoprotein N-acyltransferase
MVQNGAHLLVNITNDAWFGRTSAAYQHFSMAVFRAVENRRYLARAANTGISGFVDPCGRIVAPTHLFQVAAAVEPVALMSEPSFYTRWGQWPLGLLVLATLSIFVRRKFKEQNRITKVKR